MDIVTYALLKKYIKSSLEGAGALQGKSAYQIAVDNGYTGTEQEWIQSLKGNPPSIGENGNWFIGDIDTGVSAAGTKDFTKLQNRPTLNGVPIEGELVNVLSLSEEQVRKILEDASLTVWDGSSNPQWTKDYNQLDNLPIINGMTIAGDMTGKASITEAMLKQILREEEENA